jgi:transcriptional regulator with XRE-family HTH domain
MRRLQNRVTILAAEKGKRENRKITRRLVSQETGISLQSVQNWFADKSAIMEREKVEILCAYFGCEISDFFELVEDDEETSVFYNVEKVFA